MTTDRPVRLSEPYPLTGDQVARFREDGFIKLKNVFDAETLEHCGRIITELTMAEGAKLAPVAQRDTYGQAFIQVGNLWQRDARAKAFSFSARLARIATELMGTQGVRMWHDQALYKEPGGGFTPWHVDQQYWPMATGLSVTAWIPLQAVSLDMGPLCFGRGSHLKNIGRDLAISDESEQLIRQAVKEQGVLEVYEPYELGEVSFHYGWTLHRAGPNTTDTPRRVHTVIYMDRDMKLAEPKNASQENDWRSWTPSTKLGDIMADPKNPILYEV
jgi:hypothetical protein